jgi:hypothetical protein
MATDYTTNGAGRRKISPGQLRNLLGLRLSDLRACLARIEGIDRGFHEHGLQMPVRLPPLPGWQEIDDAKTELWRGHLPKHGPRLRRKRGSRSRRRASNA